MTSNFTNLLPSLHRPFSNADVYQPIPTTSTDTIQPFLDGEGNDEHEIKDEEDGDIEMQQVNSGYRPQNSTPSYRNYRLIKGPEKPWQFFLMGALTVTLLFGGAYTVFALFRHPIAVEPQAGRSVTTEPQASLPVTTVPQAGPLSPNQATIDPLSTHQSKSLQQARDRYSLKNDGREPPEHYDDWYSFAQERQCLIDGYDRVYKDFEPFYQLAEEDPEYFKRALDKALRVAKAYRLNLRAYEIKDGQVGDAGGGGTIYEGEWPRTFKRFAQYLPNMTFVLNGQDEPRVLFDYRRPNVRQHALNMSDTTPFLHRPYPTAEFFGPQGEGRCLLPNSKTGFGDLTNDHNAFLLNSATTQFTTDLLPILSVTKISPCFSDILVPSEFYYSDTGYMPKYKRPDTTKWEEKEQKLYWWGSTSGGMIKGQNYHEFPRFKLIDIARNHSDILEVGLSVIPMYANCRNLNECDAPRIQKEYGLGRVRPREEVYKYRYAFDVDGNSFSGRYLGLLRTNSLVFKSTVFDEYFNNWLRPFEHYIPVLPDLSDLVQKVQWAIAHDDEARRIQQNGKLLVERILTDAQNDCYFFAVLLEYARLQKGTKILKRNVPKL